MYVYMYVCMHVRRHAHIDLRGCIYYECMSATLVNLKQPGLLAPFHTQLRCVTELHGGLAQPTLVLVLELLFLPPLSPGRVVSR